MTKKKAENSTHGIVLMAFNKPAYGKMAFNMALTIKHYNPAIQIQLIHDQSALSHLNERHKAFFDIFTSVYESDIWDEVPAATPVRKLNYRTGFNPGKAKASLYKYLAFDHNIYLDVDGVAIKDLQPLFDLCIEKGQHYYCQTVGHHTIDQGRDFKAMQWAWADDIWAHYQLTPGTVLPATNSSFSYIRKCKESEELYAQVLENFTTGAMPLQKLRLKWGGTYPDELALNVALAQKGINPDLGMHPVYFNIRTIGKDFSHLNENYYVLGVFGGKGFTHSSVTAHYDRIVHSASIKELGVNIQFKSHTLVGDKHANKKN